MVEHMMGAWFRQRQVPATREYPGFAARGSALLIGRYKSRFPAVSWWIGLPVSALSAPVEPLNCAQAAPEDRAATAGPRVQPRYPVPALCRPGPPQRLSKDGFSPKPWIMCLQPKRSLLD